MTIKEAWDEGKKKKGMTMKTVAQIIEEEKFQWIFKRQKKKKDY